MSPKFASLREFLEAIKFSHSIFALPFALIATMLAGQGQFPEPKIWMWIILAMVGARTWAMSVNRVVDARIDAANPRTASRAVAAGRISGPLMFAYGLVGALLFLFSAAMLSRVALWCAVPVLLILASYSYTKRFTMFCHFWLGLCLGLAPLGAWVALRSELSGRIFVLTLAICFWVAGFDILYALQDQSFDTETQLHSIPSRMGTQSALHISRFSHLIAGILFVAFGALFELGALYFIGLFVAFALMVYEHWIVRKGNLEKINLAFFNLNGYIAVLLLLASGLSLWLKVQ